MGELAVTVRLNGHVVDDQVLPVARQIRIGDAADAALSFPGADIAVVRMGRRLALRGRNLEEGDEMTVSLGAVEVNLEHTLRFPTVSEWTGTIDGRFLAVVAVAALCGAWFDAAQSWAGRQAGTEQCAQRRWSNRVCTAAQGRSGCAESARVRPRPWHCGRSCVR